MKDSSNVSFLNDWFTSEQFTRSDEMRNPLVYMQWRF